MTKIKARITAVCLSAAIAAFLAAPVTGAAESVLTKYSDYISSSEYGNAKTDIKLNGADFDPSQSSAALERGEFGSAANCVLWKSQDDEVSYKFNVPENGLYNITVTYQSVSKNGLDFEFSLMIDGKVPFEAAETLLLPQMWKNSGVGKKDSAGNEYAPEQVSSGEFTEKKLYDRSGSVPYELLFAFGSGSHTVTFKKQSGEVVISSVALTAPANTEKYEDVKKQYSANGYKEYSGTPVVIEGEAADLKSTRSLVPKSDNSSADVNPHNAVTTVMNYIGDSNWASPGDELIWKIDVPEDGLYKIGFNYKQDKVINGISYRSLKIDGEYPFDEAKYLKFNYGTAWQFMTAGNGSDDYLFYLTKGSHTLSMCVTMGETAVYYTVMEDMVEKIGDLYLEIVTITGTSPDANRDYDLFRQIPEFNNRLTEYGNTLKQLANDMKSLSGRRGSQYIAAVNNMARVINSIIENPYTAQNYVSDYYSNYTTMGSWLSEMKSMPLSIDSIQLASPSGEFNNTRAGFLKGLMFGIRRFAVSFSSDYNRVSDDEKGGETLKIWVNWGRDQAMVLNSLIRESFTPETGININLELTNASLIKGILSGIQPDLTLHLSRTEPVNLAMRGALYDLNNFDDYEEVMKRFGDSAGEPYRYNGGNYALPDTQSFYMMFYRTDVFEKFGLTVPETWEDFIDTTVAIQRNNLQVYLPYVQITEATTVNTGLGGLNLFPSILMQRGKSVYNDDFTGADLNNAVSFSAFTFWTNLYTKYRIPTVSSFYNRFRVGTSPLGIESYTFYTTLSEAAPEIDGKWAIALVPGTKKDDGTIDHTVSGSGSGCAILQKSKNKKAAWEFLKWWTSADVQLKYNNDVESILGAVSRTTTATVDAFAGMSWNRNDLQLLLKQREYIKEIPEVPGSYYLSRAVDQAFWEVYNNDGNPKDTLIKWNDVANGEIERKIKEYSK